MNLSFLVYIPNNIKVYKLKKRLHLSIKYFCSQNLRKKFKSLTIKIKNITLFFCSKTGRILKKVQCFSKYYPPKKGGKANTKVYFTKVTIPVKS